MILTTVLFVLLALVPVMAVFVFRSYSRERKTNSILSEVQGIRKAAGKDPSALPPMFRDYASDEEVKRRVDESYHLANFLFPALLLTVIYAFLFTLAGSLLHFRWFGSVPPFHDFPASVLDSQKTTRFLFAFSGVYLLNLGMLVRRAYIFDLTEQFYWASFGRITLVMGLALALIFGVADTGTTQATVDGILKGLEKVISDPVFFFSMGFIGGDVAKFIIIRGGRALGALKHANTDQSLLRISGIDVWRLNRLEEEGIEDVQHLATCDIIQLAIRTHYNLRTLVDWVDQAVLIHRMKGDGMVLRDSRYISGATDMAWLSPERTNTEDAVELTATALGKEKGFVRSIMNSFYEDNYVLSCGISGRVIWSEEPEARCADDQVTCC